jgi:hypothetical protein
MIALYVVSKSKVLENTMRSSYRKMKLGKLIFWWALYADEARFVSELRI